METLLIVCIIIGLVNIFLSLTLLSCLSFLVPTPTKNMMIFRKVILVVSLVDTVTVLSVGVEKSKRDLKI